MENINTEEVTEKQWSKWFWKNYHEVCLSCINNCKQSSKVDLSCEKFKKGE